MRRGLAVLVAVLLAQLLLAGCGDRQADAPPAPALTIATPEEAARIAESLKQLPHLNPSMVVTPAEAARIKAAWPRMVAKVPGLKKYWSWLEFKGVERFPDCSTALTFKVTDEPGHIPGAYIARGHTCWLCLSDDGNSVSIWKASCQALFSDEPVLQATDTPLVIPLSDQK